MRSVMRSEPKNRKNRKNRKKARSKLTEDDDLHNGNDMQIRAIGFKKKTNREVVDVPYCYIATEAINAELALLRENEFLNQLYTFGPQKIVYMSCDPATQARDSKGIISAGYRIVAIQPFDLFPQTRHIENLVTFVKVR